LQVTNVQKSFILRKRAKTLQQLQNNQLPSKYAQFKINES